MKSAPRRTFDQPERDWLQQLRRRRAIWLSVSFVVLVLTVLGLFNLSSRRRAEPAPTGEQTAFVFHGRSAGGAAGQLLVSALSAGRAPAEIELPDPVPGAPAGDSEAEGTYRPGLETGPADAPYLRRKTLTSAEVTELASRYFLDDDVVRALRLAWCLSGFDPQAIDARTGRVGLFQHDPAFWPDHAQLAGFRGYDPFDPVANTAVAAYLVYEGEGWQTWDCQT